MKRLAGASLAAGGTLEHAGQARMSEVRHRYHPALLIGRNQTAARAGPLMRKHHALAERLLAREDGYLRFTAGPLAPFDNKREIRMSKLRIKVSGCMRSMAGAGSFCAIRSAVHRRQARHRQARRAHASRHRNAVGARDDLRTGPWRAAGNSSLASGIRRRAGLQ